MSIRDVPSTHAGTLVRPGARIAYDVIGARPEASRSAQRVISAHGMLSSRAQDD